MDSAKHKKEQEVKEPENKEEPKEEESQKDCTSESCDCHHASDEISSLKAQVVILESQLAKLKKEQNKKILEFVEKKSKEAAELVEKNKKEFAERCKQDYEDKIKFFYSRQLSELVDVVSQFEIVINSVTDPSVAAYLVGFKMFLSQFESLLSSFHISPIIPQEGDEFDSDIMVATSTKKIEDKKLDNKIVQVFRKGYKLHERVIKLSSVEVGKLEE